MKNSSASSITKETPLQLAKITIIMSSTVMYTKKTVFSYPAERRVDLYSFPGREP